MVGRKLTRFTANSPDVSCSALECKGASTPAGHLTRFMPTTTLRPPPKVGPTSPLPVLPVIGAFSCCLSLLPFVGAFRWCLSLVPLVVAFRWCLSLVPLVVAFRWCLSLLPVIGAFRCCLPLVLISSVVSVTLGCSAISSSILRQALRPPWKSTTARLIFATSQLVESPSLPVRSSWLRVPSLLL